MGDRGDTNLTLNGVGGWDVYDTEDLGLVGEDVSSDTNECLTSASDPSVIESNLTNLETELSGVDALSNLE